jgi:hypothetical protein
VAATVFDFVAELLEARSHLGKLEARGTVRLTLKESGLDPDTVTTRQMRVVLEKVLPKEVERRGVEAAQAVCDGIVAELEQSASRLAESESDSPEDVFRRLAGG